MAEGLIPVEFLKSWSPYNRGDIAGFKKEVADWLVEKKYAKKTPKGKSKPE